MTDKLLAHPLVNFHWSSSIAGISGGDDEVTLTVSTAFGTRELRAAWVVAADGGRSKMRELGGIRLQGNSYEGNYVIADIHWESELRPSVWCGSTHPAIRGPRSSCTANHGTSGASTTSSMRRTIRKRRRKKIASVTASRVTSSGSRATSPGPWNGSASTAPTHSPWKISLTAVCSLPATPRISFRSSVFAASTLAWRMPRPWCGNWRPLSVGLPIPPSSRVFEGTS